MHLESNDCFAHCCEAGCEFVELLGDDDLILIGSGSRDISFLNAESGWVPSTGSLVFSALERSKSRRSLCMC